MLKVVLLFLFLTVSLLYSSEFEIQTSDPIMQERDGGFSKSKNLIKSKEFVQEDALYKPDPLLETLQDKKEEKPTLLEKILLQTHNRNETKQNDKKTKKVFKKSLNKSNELITPDPLLDEI